MDSIIARPPVINVDFSEPEIWVRRRPEMGDHIRVMRAGGLYAHHGVYVSDDEIIHFTGTEDDSILDWSKPIRRNCRNCFRSWKSMRKVRRPIKSI